VNELDNGDKSILKLLFKDSNLSYRKIAEKLNKATGTISSRVKNLEESGIIKNFGINVDYEKLGFDVTAIMELRISKGKLLEVENKLAEDPFIFGVYDITGVYDCLLLLRTRTRAELNLKIKEILKFEYIERTNTHIVLTTVKEDHSSLDELI
jgi:DNA-binding Lrp family transcriptional regulator